MSHKYRIAFIILTFLPFYCAGQDEIDSLKQFVNQAQNENELVKSYGELAWAYRKYEIDSAIYYGKKGLNLAEAKGFEKEIADLHRRLGVFYRNNLDFYNASNHLENSIKGFENLNDINGLAASYVSFANLANDLTIDTIALSYYEDALQIYKKLGKTGSIGIAQVRLNIATIYTRQGNYNLANKYTQEALNIFIQQDSYSNMVPSYINLGEIKELEGSSDKAWLFYNLGLEFAAKSATAKTDSVDALLHIGRLSNRMGDFQNANVYLFEGYPLAYEVGTKSNIKDYEDQLILALNGLNKPKEAMVHVMLSRDIEEEIKKIDTRNAILAGRLEARIREQSLINQKIKLRNIIYMILLGLFFFTVLILFRNYRIKQKANKLLAEMDELKSHLYSNISHEFRTPLTLILGPLEQMLAEDTGKTPTKKTIKMMQRNANRLLELVNQMLDLSKVEAGNMKLELIEGDVLKSLRILLSSFSSLAVKKEIKYEQVMQDGVLSTWFDADKLEKIVTNILSNAFKFTPKGGTISTEVIVSKSNDNIQIMVRDTGKGISKDQLDKIFDRFHQVEEQGDPDRIGTGIGLALTKELVDLMHGEIRVDSKLGEGTSFTISIPLGKNHLGEDEYVIVENKLPKSARDNEAMDESSDLSWEQNLEDELLEDSKFPVVLTVEDHSDIRAHIKEHLEDSCRMLEASDGEMGLSKAIEFIPDLVITDLMMPKMDGMEMCKKLKTDERTSHIPVIMLTAKASVEDRIEGLETGADAYVTKPFNIKELRVRVKNLIEQRKKLRERFSKDIKLEPKDIAITSADETFLNRALEIIESQMENSEFEVRDFQDEMGMSRMQLFRKIKALTDYSPSEFIRNLRLKRASQLMEQNYGNVAQITYKVGFNNLSYFAKCFKDLFEISPSEYLKKHAQ